MFTWLKKILNLQKQKKSKYTTTVSDNKFVPSGKLKDFTYNEEYEKIRIILTEILKKNGFDDFKIEYLLSTVDKDNIPIIIERLKLYDSIQRRSTYSSGSSSSSPITSDKRLKKNIQQISDALNKVLALRGVEFEWINNYQDTSFDNSRNIGLIAQEVEKVIPEVVDTDKVGYKSVHYGNLVALLVEAIREQQGQIDELKKVIEISLHDIIVHT
jgi:hypothetical protein